MRQSTTWQRSILLAALLLVHSTALWACSPIRVPSIDVRSDESAFIGTVTEYISHPVPAADGTELGGVKVRVDESVLDPQGAAHPREYAVYLLGLGPDCSENPVSKEWLPAYYRLGNRVWVNAAPSPSLGGGILALSGWDIRRVSEREISPRSTSADYRRASGTQADIWLKRDLVELRKPRTDRAKARFLKRMAFHESFRVQEVRFLALVYHHLKDKAMIRDVTRFYLREARWPR